MKVDDSEATIQVVPLKHLADVRTSNVDKKSRLAEIAVELCNYVDVYYNDEIRALDTDFMTATATSGQIQRFGLLAGDTVITKDSETADDIAIPAYVPRDLPRVVCGYHLSIVRPISVPGRFLYYALQSKPIRSYFETAATGITRVGLRSDAIGRTPIVVPDGRTQLIADFLDREVRRLDEVAAAKRRMIELLDEKHTALITHTMTGHLGLGLELSPSVPLRGAAHVHLGRQRSPKHASGEHMTAYLRAANVKDGRIDVSDVKRMNFDPRERAHYALAPDDILVTEGAGSLKAVGAAARYTETSDSLMCFQNTLIRLRARSHVEPSYLYWWARFAYVSELFASVASGANIYHLGVEDVRTLPIVLPPRATQRKVSEYLDTQLSTLNAASDALTRQLDLLAEFKSALITAAVTGQLDEATLKGEKSLDDAMEELREDDAA